MVQSQNWSFINGPLPYRLWSFTTYNYLHAVIDVRARVLMDPFSYLSRVLVINKYTTIYIYIQYTYNLYSYVYMIGRQQQLRRPLLVPVVGGA